MKPRNPPVFFLDRSLGKCDVPTALRDADYTYKIHDEHFPPNTPDQEWMARLDRRWIVLTKDEKIRYRPLELQALRDAGLRVFIVICGNVRGTETARIIVDAIPRIIAAVQRTKGPCVFYVYKNSTIRRARC